jgi:hypothetical protein
MRKELKRMNYFDGLFLKAEDYKQDKEYQRRLQGFHNRYLHTWGIACGLEVKPVIDSSMEVVVTEGVALDLTDKGNYGSDVEESTSRQILIYEGHPDNPLDLSDYPAGENIYISVNYNETGADRDNEKGQGEEIHIWECGQISYDNKKPENCKENIILARVVPRQVEKKIINSDGIATSYDEVVVDSTCIFENDVDGTPLRVYAGPYARVLELKEFIFKMGEDINKMPFIAYMNDPEQEELSLAINSNNVRFSGAVDIQNDLVFEGKLIRRKKDGTVEKEFTTEEQFLQLNSLDEDNNEIAELWKPRDAGMEVFRGPNVSADARIVWSEGCEIWKAGIGNDLSPIAYGPDWEKLNNPKSPENPKGPQFADGLHKHSRLFSSKGAILSVDKVGDISSKVDLVVPRKVIALSKSSGVLSINDNEIRFAGMSVEGPVFTGSRIGILGTTENGQKPVLSWNENGSVGIGPVAPADMLDVGGSARLMSSVNPIRITSQWTGFPDLSTNQAEICNDTTYHKALMIVGNQSAGQGRKVAIWDRLDVNGLLNINGTMRVAQKILTSAGNGRNGIIFPGDPGGGAADSAWIKYYPRSGEACTLELGTSNDGDDNISIITSGNAGFGTYTPYDKLDVSGITRIMSASNPIRFTSSWSGFPDISSRNAEICNDIGTYKTLMIIGNSSGGQGRRVSIWDRLDVNGSMLVTTNLEVSGAIIPGVGTCNFKSIMFQKDPYGGSGDAAWLSYYSDTARGGGENMTFEIGISNDSNLETIEYREWVNNCPVRGVSNPCGYWKYYSTTIRGNKGDRLRLYASGGTYVEGNFYYTSTKEIKENISELSRDVVKNALEGLEPVEFNFKGDYDKTTMGFIAEEVPEICSASDNKAISPMEIITLLVSEVKEQEYAINRLKKKIKALEA